jgi:hypothetical protein
MGYDIHLTRCADWWDEGGPEITADEWEAVVASDAELSMIPDPLGWTGPVWRSALLNTHPDETRFGTALHWDGGGIRAKNPSDLLIAKMCGTARVLGGGVRFRGTTGSTTAGTGGRSRRVAGADRWGRRR